MLKHILIYTPARIVPAAVGLLNLGIFTRVLSAEQYGYFALAVAIAFVLDGFLGQWLTAGIMRFYAARRSEEEIDQLLASCGVLFLLPAIVLCAVGATILCLSLESGPQQTALLVALPYFFFFSLQQLVLRVHMAAINSIRYAIFNMLQALLSAAFAIGIVMRYADPSLAVMGITAGIAGTLLADWRTTRRLLTFTQARRSTMVAVVRFSWPIMVASGLAFVSARLNRFLLLAFMGAGAVGLYNAGQVLAEQAIAAIFMIIAAAAQPITVKVQETEAPEALQARLRHNAIWIFGLGLPSAAGLAIIAPEVSTLFLGEKFRSTAVQMIPLLAISAFFSGLRVHFVVHSYFLARKLHFGLYISVLSLAVMAITNVMLIPAYGILGAVVASLLTEGVCLIAAYALTFHAVRLPLPLLDIGKIVVATVVMAAILQVLPAMPSLLALIAKLGAAGLCIGGIALVLNFGDCATKTAMLAKRLLASSPPLFVIFGRR